MYLNKCIDSIIAQTYAKLEIILVDDGSTDSSGVICDEYALKDKRIIVLHKLNGGLGDARNAALDICQGKYITCIDSDDYLENDYVEYLYELLLENDADISTCALKMIYDFREKLDACDEDVEILNTCEALKSILYQGSFVVSACCKLYKRELFEGIRYPKGMYYEDLAVIYKLVERCDRIAVGKKQKYYYFQRSNSIMNGTFNPKKMHRIQIVNELKDYVDKIYPELCEATSTRCFKTGLLVYQEIPYKKEYKEYIEITWQQIKKYRWSTVKNSEASISIRLIALSTYLGKRILATLGNLQAKVFKK